MTDKPEKPVLLTGASGALGRVLTRALAQQGWSLRLTDIANFPETLPESATFTKADLNDGVTLLRLAEGCGAILPFRRRVGGAALRGGARPDIRRPLSCLRGRTP